MSSVNARLPTSLLKKLRQCARQGGSSVNQLIASAVAEMLAALLTEDYLEERAKRGSRKKFDAVLKTVPDVEPEEFDRLPQKVIPGKKRRG